MPNGDHTKEIEKIQIDQKWLKKTLANLSGSIYKLRQKTEVLNQRDAKRESDIAEINTKLDKLLKQTRR